MMIGFENYVYTQIYGALENAYGAGVVKMGGEYVDPPPKFPFVTVEQIDSYVKRSRRTTNIENMDTVSYEVNVYSNKKNNRKSEAISIMAVVNHAMASIGFTRTMMNPVPNLSNSTIYRLTARYSADAEEEIIGDDTVYTVYQN